MESQENEQVTLEKHREKQGTEKIDNYLQHDCTRMDVHVCTNQYFIVSKMHHHLCCYSLFPNLFILHPPQTPPIN